jgi:aspartate beta-hydroxylase
MSIAMAAAGGAEARLVAQVEAALQKGDPGLAELACQQLLDAVPGHLDATAFLCGRAMATGAYSRARRLAERAAAAHPESGVPPFHLGCALEAVGERARALEAFRGAVARDPRQSLAWLRRSALEHAMGLEEESLRSGHAGLEAATRDGIADNLATLPPALRDCYVDTWQRVQDARAAALDAAVEPLRRKWGVPALARIQRAIDMHAGRVTQEWPHPQQRPAFLLLPGLDPRPWFEREEFPFLDTIERETDAIRAEMLAVLTDRDDLRPYVDMPHDAPAARVWGELIDNPRWSAYHFYRHGERIDAHHERCPRTSAALAALPLMHIPGHAPEAMFSVLAPRTRIPPHTGSINGRLIVHLPLVVPKDCGALACADQPRPWVEGRCFVFDDSIKHEAWNDSDQTRVVLIFDVWNPQLTPAEREGLALVVEHITLLNRRWSDKDGDRERKL